MAKRTRYRDFDAEQRERVPVAFTLGGVDFQATGLIPAGALIDLMQAENDDDAVKAFAAFFRAVLPEAQHDAFGEAVQRVDLRVVAELQRWLIAESGKPAEDPRSTALSWSAEDS